MKNLFSNTHADPYVDPNYLGTDDIDPANLEIGVEYIIQSVGDTDWVSLGATDGVRNEQFTATAQAGAGTTGLAIQAHGLYDRVVEVFNTNANNSTSATRYPQFKTHLNSQAPTQNLKDLTRNIARFNNYYDYNAFTGDMSRQDLWNNVLLTGTVTQVNTQADVLLSIGSNPAANEDEFTLHPSYEQNTTYFGGTRTHIEGISLTAPANSSTYGLSDGDPLEISGVTGSYFFLNGTTKYLKVFYDRSTHTSYELYDDALLTTPTYKRDRVYMSVAPNYGEARIALVDNPANNSNQIVITPELNELPIYTPPFFDGEEVEVDNMDGDLSVLNGNNYYIKQLYPTNISDSRFILTQDQAGNIPVTIPGGSTQSIDLTASEILNNPYPDSRGFNPANPNNGNAFEMLARIDLSNYLDDSHRLYNNAPGYGSPQISFTSGPLSGSDYFLVPADAFTVADANEFYVTNVDPGLPNNQWQDGAIPWQFEESAGNSRELEAFKVDAFNNLHVSFTGGQGAVATDDILMSYYTTNHLGIQQGTLTRANTYFSAAHGYNDMNAGIANYWKIGDWNSSLSAYKLIALKPDAGNSNGYSWDFIQEDYFSNQIHSMFTTGLTYTSEVPVYDDSNTLQINSLSAHGQGGQRVYFTLESSIASGDWEDEIYYFAKTGNANVYRKTVERTSLTKNGRPLYFITTSTDNDEIDEPFGLASGSYDTISDIQTLYYTGDTDTTLPPDTITAIDTSTVSFAALTDAEGMREHAMVWFDTADIGSSYSASDYQAPDTIYMEDDSDNSKVIAVWVGERKDSVTPSIIYQGYIMCDYDEWYNYNRLQRLPYTNFDGSGKTYNTQWQTFRRRDAVTWDNDNFTLLPLENESRIGSTAYPTGVTIHAGHTHTVGVQHSIGYSNTSLANNIRNYNYSSVSQSLIAEIEPSVLSTVDNPQWVNLRNNWARGSSQPASIRAFDKIAGSSNTFYLMEIDGLTIHNNVADGVRYTNYDSEPDGTESNVLTGQLTSGTTTHLGVAVPNMIKFSLMGKIESVQSGDGLAFMEYGYLELAEEIGNNVWQVDYETMRSFVSTVTQEEVFFYSFSGYDETETSWRDISADDTEMYAKYLETDTIPSNDSFWYDVSNADDTRFGTFDVDWDWAAPTVQAGDPSNSGYIVNRNIPSLTDAYTGNFLYDAPPLYELQSIDLLHGGNSAFTYQDTNNVTQPGVRLNSKYWNEWETTSRNLATLPNITLTQDGNGYVTGATLNANHLDDSYTQAGKVIFELESLDDTYVPVVADIIAAEDVFTTTTDWSDPGEGIKDWPTDIWPASVVAGIDQPSSTTKSISGIKYVRNSAFMRWNFEATYPPMNGEQFRKFWSAAQKARGQSIPFKFYMQYGDKRIFNFNPDLNNIGIVKADAAIGDSVIYLEGFAGAEQLKEGQLITLQNRNGGINTVIQDVDTNVYGEVKIILAYPLDYGLSKNDTVDLDPDYVIVTLADNAFEYTRDTVGLYYVKVKFDFDEWK